MSERGATLEAVLAGERRWVVLEQDNLPLLCNLPERTFDVVLTDPPYDHFSHKFGRSTSTWKAARAEGIQTFEQLEDPAALAAQLVRLAKRWAIAFCAVEDLGAYRSGLAVKEWVRAGIWDKVVPGPQVSADRPGNACEGLAIMHREGRKRWGRGGGAGIWRHQPAHGAERWDHPCPKPLRLMLDLVRDFSEPGEVIFDPFAGSGTTGVAALNLGRRVVLVEKNAQYADVARRRMEASESSADAHLVERGQGSLFADCGAQRGCESTK